MEFEELGLLRRYDLDMLPIKHSQNVHLLASMLRTFNSKCPHTNKVIVRLLTFGIKGIIKHDIVHSHG